MIFIQLNWIVNDLKKSNVELKERCIDKACIAYVVSLLISEDKENYPIIQIQYKGFRDRPRQLEFIILICLGIYANPP